MITFKKIKYKNLLSTGNVFTEIDLLSAKTNLIVGANGHGKSTVLDALTFALFGKAFRNINKPTLINSVNGRDCVVEIEFNTNGREYKVVRGIKPTVFEIWVDDILLNQDSASKDYQEYLEKIILKMNYKAFTQIVILGSASFVPFMQLTPADRRAIIEGLLDIQIFSTMNVLVKQRAVSNKEALDLNRVALKGTEDKKSYIERTLASLRQNSDDRLVELQRQHQDLTEQKKELLDKVFNLGEEKEALVGEITNLSDLRKSYEKHSRIIIQNESTAEGYARDKVALNWGKECPTCKQEIEEGFKNKRMKELDGMIGTTLDKNKEIQSIVNDTLALITEKEEKSKRIQAINAEIKSSKQTMMHFVSTMNELEDSIEKIQNADKLVQDSEQELVETIQEISRLEEERSSLLEDKKYVETALALLKDGGIKTKIIKQYIPIINKLVNKYLAQMGFFVNFNIDENFNEVIKSRYRDEFSYANFSEGEKTRIDLALLFTWRAIAKMKNSVNTNLLVLDEILDGSLDANGTDEFLKIIKSLTDGTNTFIISHKQDQLLDKFDKTYKFLKVKNFSQLVP